MKTNFRIPTILLATLLVLLMGCEPSDRSDVRASREGARYQAAMLDYQGGRLDAALKGFEEVVRDDPANAPARFQLACLLQDHARRYFDAACNYREYLRLAPQSDKVDFATERFNLCERALAAELADKYELSGGKSMAKELEAARAEIKAQVARNEKSSQNISEAMTLVVSLKRENARLLALIREEDGESAKAAPSHNLTDARAILDEDESTDPEHGKLAADIAKLRQEEVEENIARPAILPGSASERGVADKARPALGSFGGEKPAAAHTAAGTHPEYYVVQDGDTLYKIAVRFYGRTSAWRKIRAANKALITTDGRVKTGQRLKLPK